MDTKIKKYCPNCSQPYVLKSVSHSKQSNLPLYLSCGHTMCESCITNIVKFEEPIECRICHRDMQVTSAELAAVNQKKTKLYQLFPVNLSMLGELTLQNLEQSSERVENKDNEYFVDVQAIIKSIESTQGQCMECHCNSSKMCQECTTVLCDACFNKTHKNFVIFKNHVLKNIEPVSVSNKCKVHKGKALDYYCDDCHKSICMDCLMVGGDKSCKNHNVVSMQEVNENFLEEVIDITPKVDETYRRLTKTAVDVGHLLHNIENETGTTSELTNMLASVKQHFSKLTAAIQKHEQEVLNIIVKLKCSEKESLRKAKNDLADSIKKARTVLNAINSTSDKNKAKQINLSVLLDEAKQVVEIPWYLCKDESNDPLKVAVNEDLCSLVSDYIHLEGNANSVYKLRGTTELGDGVEVPPPPPAPVFPPELPKDVRQLVGPEKSSTKNQTPVFFKNVPKYRSKSGSLSSLNSLQSDSSDKSFAVGDGYQNFQRQVHQVQPFAESQHPKQLREGMQELIYITHIVDAHNFFVQRSCHQSLVKEMLREFRNAGSLPKPSLNHVAEGKTYLMFNKADNMWQRCRVISIDRKDLNNPKFLVFCIDFGSTETVSIDKLRLLPPARVQSPYPLAINCALANCEPKAGGWTTDDAFLIQNIIDNKQAILNVRHVRSTSFSMKLECDVFTFEEGISIAHALVFHGRARMPNTKLSYPKINGVMERPRLYMSYNDLKPKSVEEVYITHVVSPDKFYVRKKHLMPVYERLCEDLEQEYSLSNTGNVFLPEIGMSYVVNVEKCPEMAEECGGGGGAGEAEGAFRGRWRRGVVQELPGRGRVRVLLPDCGRALLVHWTALRYMHHKFTTQRALASECHLAGVTPLNKKWSCASVALLQRWAGRPLELHVEEARRGSPGVTLLDHNHNHNHNHPNTDEPLCLNTEMIKHKFAVTFGLFMFNKNSAVEDQVFTNKSPLDEPKTHSKPPGQIQVLQKDKTPQKINEEELDAKDKGPLRLEAKVLHYQSPSLLYVSLVHQQKAFSELYEEIQKHYSKKKTQAKEWSVGDRCCTLCIQSQTWRRAAIVELDGDNAKVFYSDFACLETVPTASLRELAPEFVGIGDAAIKCHLCGIVPADGSDEWPTITKEYLKELLDAYPRVFITKLGQFKNKSMPVEVWVYHTIQGGALEPNHSEWRCLNSKIIEQGLGIPDKTQLHTSTTESESSKDDMLSFLKNVTGSVDEWLQLEPLPQRPLVSRAEPCSPALSSGSAEPDAPPAAPPAPAPAPDADNTEFISDWLPPEPLQCDEFTAMPTYIDHEGVIYLHDVSQQDTLELIRKALDVRFKAPDPKAKYAKWSVGEPCVALYFLDNRFYRGRVLEVHREERTCLIHYIDYGNDELCSFDNLRKSIALYQIPTQARRCVLARVRPAAPSWDRQTLDYIHKSIVEKHCLVRVAGPPRAGVTPIDLKYDKLWINDHLVDFEMAVYTDGSKPVVRKYAGAKRAPPAPAAPPAPPSLPRSEHDSSGPDYILDEEQDDTESHASFRSLDGKDWNQLVEEEQSGAPARGTMLTYPSNNLTEFSCTVTGVPDADTLELALERDAETAARYERLLGDVRARGADMPPLHGVYEHKACVALYREDGTWYRAEVLQYSEAKAMVKVRYVDYGNVEVVPLADVREAEAEWAELPPGSERARLPGLRADPALSPADLARHYSAAFVEAGVVRARVVARQHGVPLVELRGSDDRLLHEQLVRDKVLLPCD